MKHKQDKRKRQIKRRILSMVLVFAMLFNIVPLSDLGIDLSKKLGVIKSVESASYSFNGNEFGSSGTVTLSFTKAIELRRFSCWYNTYADDKNLNDVYYDITLNLDSDGYYWDLYSSAAWNTYDTSSDVTDAYVYESIGTSDNPFYGKLNIPTTSISLFYSRVPLFDYVDQRTQIHDATGNVRTLEFFECEKDGDTSSLKPILANHVVKNSSSATSFAASVKLIYFNSIWDEYADSSGKNFAGIIGEIGTESTPASVNLTVQNDAAAGTKKANVENSSGPVGLLCQKINDNSTLNATINTGTNTSYTVSAASNNAGGLVGEMKTGATLSVSGRGLNGVTQEVTGNYAAGIVGYAKDAQIGNITDSYKTTSTTVNGTSASGYVFGYYENTVASRSFNITWTESPTISLTGSYSGGLVGDLKNKNTTGSTIAIDGEKTVDSSTASSLVSGSKTFNVTVSASNAVYNKGGVIGRYTTSSIKNILDIENCSVYISNVGDIDSGGGIIGRISKESDCTDAYVKFANIYTKTSNNTNGGGLIGAAGERTGIGAFIDVSGYIKIDGKYNSGLVKRLDKGVLKIQGITDLSDLTAGNYIVGIRDSALVYSRGKGNDAGTAANEWRLIRHSHDSNDVGTWGEVLRLNNSSLNGTQIVDETDTYDSTKDNYHTVTLKPAPSVTISTLTDFALLALNIQLNTTATSGVLKVSGTNSSTLLGSTITLDAVTFNLSGTGITGLTRDTGDYKEGSYDYRSNVFQGTIAGTVSGDNKTTITLAIGEPYGVDSNGTAVTASDAGCGKIYNHAYNGLLARTNGATISNININGTQTQRLGINGANMQFGAVSAQSAGRDYISGVSSSVSVNVSRHSNNRIIAGGFIGITATSASDTISFQNCASTAVFSDATRNDDNQPESYFGGYIGLVDCSGGANAKTNNPLTVTFGTSGGTNPCAVGGSYTSNYTTASLNTIYGGLIGAVRGNNSHSIYNSSGSAFRTINAYAVTVDGLRIDSKSNTASGGLLGYAWHDAEVNLQNVTVGGTSANTVTISGGTATKLAGLVYNATGHWSVGTVSINNTTFTAANASSSLGLLVNSTVNECQLNIDNNTSYGYAKDKKAGLLLEITNKSNYTVESTAALNIDSKVTVYDEIAAFSMHPDKTDIADNGHSIISINTDGSGTAVTMTGSSCNTYQNQSDYGKNTVTVNPNTRYYYNLDTIRVKESPTDAEKLLLWSLDKYALNTAVSNFFNGAKSGTNVSTLSGNLDMEGLSYYPVDYSSVTFGSISKLKFYNYEIETAEGLTGNGNTDGVTRSTTDATNKSQHYMMHCGLFRNVSANLTLDDITVEGNVGLLPSGSGFLVCGTVGGGSSVTTVGNSSSKSITLNGAYVRNANSASYAPLLINCIDSNSTLNINGVKSEGYTSFLVYAATSLIGKAGESDGNDVNIKLNFSKITLDSRVQNIPSPADNSRFTTVYGSTISIFKNATLLEQFCYTDTSSVGTYNYTSSEDWETETITVEGVETSVPKHNVTYGQEIIGTKDHIENGESQQNRYYGESIYTDPRNGTNSSAQYANFTSTYFLPYVANIGDAGDIYKELNVNISSTSLTVGCGTYNDPYVVNAKMLDTVAKILRGDDPAESVLIRLPDGGSSTGIATNYSTGDINLLWCTGDTFHHDFHWNGSVYKCDDEGISNTYGKAIVQKYLAGAYYVIDNNMTLPSSFAGLGGISAATAFRGVIVGKEITETRTDPDTGTEMEVGPGKYPKITLNCEAPFIATSNGSVVKNLNFEVSNNVTIYANQGTATQTFGYDSSCQSYGVVMGKIMGGDNIIDAVGVEFKGTITAGTNAYIVPIGGYVGVVVNGGLFFRNMGESYISSVAGLTSSSIGSGFDTMTVGESSCNALDSNNTKYLYFNPIIGRVINGYAVTEDASYVPGAASQTMKNGTKNYAITNIDKTACVGGTNASKILDVQSSAINVPDAQAWFIMSCIVNSGSGNANGTDSTTLKVQDGSTLSYSVADFKSTHIGTYDNVGVRGITKSVTTDVIFTTDNYELSNKAGTIPYILYKYTAAQSGKTQHYARLAKSISKIARTIIMNPSYATTQTAAEWTLPDGYRGIGGLNATSGAANNGYNITVSGLTCNNTTINLNMKYQTYLYSTTNKISQENYYPSDVGFGLFNTFNNSAAITVSNLTLKGNAYVDTLDKATGEPKHIYGKKNNFNAYDSSWKDFSATSNGRVSVGMFSGLKSNNTALTISNVTLDTISVHSSRSAGGLVGIAQYVTITDCPATNISVEGEWDTGGYIGGASNNVTIAGNSTNKTEFNINTIVMTGVGNNERINGRPGGVGGLIGRQYGGTVNISYLKLTKNGVNGIVKNYQDQNDISSDETAVGGIVGATHNNLMISNCEVNSITVYGDYANAGGVLGSFQHNSNATYTVDISNVSLDGTNAKDGLFITNRLGLGGFIGKINLNKTVNVTIADSSIKNYVFKKGQHNSAGDNYVGGIIGVQPGDSSSNTILKNVLISDCVFDLPANGGKYGGIVGSLRKPLYGYNIAMNNISLASGTTASWYKADILGDASNTKPNVKIVGFSRQNTPTNSVYNGTVGTDSYIIFSDYSGTGFNGSGQTTAATINGSANTTPAASVDINTPYANVNPSLTIWSTADHKTVLTGDGMSDSYNNLPISSIKNDLAITNPSSETQSRYNKRYSIVGTGITNNITSDNFTTFNTEWGAGTVANNFAMLLIEDTNRANTTSLINNYVQALTNQTKYADFGADSPTSGTSSLIYKVNLYKMSLVDSDDDGTYDYFAASSANDRSVHLHRNTTKKQFYMSSTDPDDVDSAEDTPTFTLMDVAFYDPTISSSQNVAYHLYIPIYVKKLMKFSFTVGTAANTPYDSSVYQNSMLMDNLGAAGSLYFAYTYERTKQEWQEALDYGENFLTNYDKILTMSKLGTSTGHFDNNTLIALVDNNQKDKVYYARFSDVFNSGRLTIYNSSLITTSSFKTGISSGTGFVPVNLCDLLNITAVENSSGGFVKIDTNIENEDVSKATVKIGDDYYRPKGTNENVDDADAYSTYYTLTVVNLAGNNTTLADSADLHVTESYYMSLFTRTSSNQNLINYYRVTSPDKLSGGGAPAKAPVSPGAVNILFGNLFTQSSVTYQANYNNDNPALIDADNNTVKVKLDTTIRLTNIASQEISTLIGGQSIYQSFLVYLTRYDGGNVTKAILGTPTAIASYTIDPVRNGSSLPQKSGGDVSNGTDSQFANVSSNYVEVASDQNIASYLVDGGAKITAYVYITYGSQESRSAQFPGRATADDTTKYAYVTADSNIGFDPDTTALSKTQSQATMSGTEMHYYVMSSTSPTLEYNAFADAEGDIYGQLGINANDLDDNSGKVDVKTEAVYNISPIADDVEGYDYVKVTFELKKKQQGTYDTYEAGALQIRTYMKDVVIDNSSLSEAQKTPKIYSGGAYADAGATATEYSFILPRSSVATNGDNNLLTIPISFKVFTGSDVTEGESASFEGKGLMYSNYMITVSCEMLQNATDEETDKVVSRISNYIIYTNAKLIKDFIESE